MGAARSAEVGDVLARGALSGASLPPRITEWQEGPLEERLVVLANEEHVAEGRLKVEMVRSNIRISGAQAFRHWALDCKAESGVILG